MNCYQCDRETNEKYYKSGDQFLCTSCAGKIAYKKGIGLDPDTKSFTSGSRIFSQQEVVASICQRDYAITRNLGENISPHDMDSYELWQHDQLYWAIQEDNDEFR